MPHSCSVRVSCTNCHKETSLLNINNHYNACIKKAEKNYPVDLKCRFCGKECKNKISFSMHERQCPDNPNRKYINHKIGKKGSNQYIKAEKLGLCKPEMSQEARIRISEANKKRTPEFFIELGKKVSKTINEKVANGTWHTSLARHMHYVYNGVDLHCSWELAYAKYLDSNNIKWIRCKNSFPYIFENKLRRYTPDFYLIDSCEYVEIKGFKIPKDDAKWNQFPNHLKLTVLMENELKALGVL